MDFKLDDAQIIEIGKIFQILGNDDDLVADAIRAVIAISECKTVIDTGQAFQKALTIIRQLTLAHYSLILSTERGRVVDEVREERIKMQGGT